MLCDLKNLGNKTAQTQPDALNYGRTILLV